MCAAATNLLHKPRCCLSMTAASTHRCCFCLHMQEHLFLVCELLRANLYEFQKYNRESNDDPYFSNARIQRIATQVIGLVEPGVMFLLVLLVLPGHPCVCQYRAVLALHPLPSIVSIACLIACATASHAASCATCMQHVVQHPSRTLCILLRMRLTCRCCALWRSCTRLGSSTPT